MFNIIQKFFLSAIIFSSFSVIASVGEPDSHPSGSEFKSPPSLSSPSSPPSLGDAGKASASGKGEFIDRVLDGSITTVTVKNRVIAFSLGKKLRAKLATDADVGEKFLKKIEGMKAVTINDKVYNIIFDLTKGEVYSKMGDNDLGS